MADINQQRQDSLVYVTVIMTSVSIIAVLIRSVVRFILIRNPGMDDYTILAALFFVIGYMLEILLLKENGIGFPSATLTTEMAVKSLKITLAIEATYYMIVGSIKVSIIYLYLRFAVSERFRMLCHGTIVFQVIFTFICLCVTFSQCSPIEKMFDLVPGTTPGFCINTTAFFYSTSGFNIITDIWILALPIKTLGLINRSGKEKIALIIIFGAGTFAAIMSVVRLQSIYTFTKSTDPSRDAIAVNVWSMLEVNTAILCASVPALKPIFTWKKIRDVRRPNKFPGRVSNPLEQHDFDPNRKDKLARKGSEATLYPDLEVFDLTQLSGSRTPPISPTRTTPDVYTREERRDEFSLRRQDSFHVV